MIEQRLGRRAESERCRENGAEWEGREGRTGERRGFIGNGVSGFPICSGGPKSGSEGRGSEVGNATRGWQWGRGGIPSRLGSWTWTSGYFSYESFVLLALSREGARQQRWETLNYKCLAQLWYCKNPMCRTVRKKKYQLVPPSLNARSLPTSRN